MENDTTRRFAALRYYDFRLIWSAQFISITGSMMQMVALNWQIYILTHSAFALGLIGFIRFIPIVIFSLIGGSVADAVNRKKILFITQTTLTILSIILAFLTFTHAITAISIFIITALSAVAMSFDTPARQTVVPSIVQKKDLANAMSLMTVVFQTANVLGPAIGGVLIAQIGLGWIYSINAVSFLFVLGALYFMSYSGTIEGTVSQVSLSAITEGLRFVRSKTMIWSTMLLDFFSTFFSSATALLPIFAKDILNVGPQGLGLLYSADSIGAVLAGIVIANKPLRNQGKILLSAVCCYALGTILFGISHFYLLSLFALIIVGAGDSVSTIIRNTVRQLETPDYIRGRMTSINMIFFMGGPQLGDFEAGALASLIGAPLSVVTGGVGTLIVVGIITASLPILRNYDTHKPEVTIPRS